jgi:hypothetical protein
MDLPTNMVSLSVSISITLEGKTLIYTSTLMAQTHKLPEIGAALDMLLEKTKKEAMACQS